MNKAKILKIYFLFLAAFFVFLFSGSDRIKTVFAKEGDALAVRVLQNDEHYSPLTWYYKQGFEGSPTSLKVDGYEAIRDGRTVYVNVANIDDKGTANYADDSVFTNIYLISYNQEAAPEMISIFDRVLSHWKFNSNLTVPGDCFNQEAERKCLTDTDCDQGAFCDSLKAKLIRDTKRLGDIVDIRLKIEDYKSNSADNSYPRLSSGTYLPGVTVSTWPSWNQEFSSVLGVDLPIDPINKLGVCGSDYDQDTCWDSENKTFADPNLDNNIFELPAGSEAFLYSVSENAQSYKACAYMESGFMVGDKLGACFGGSSFNNPPEINCGEMIGLAGRNFLGYIKATDLEGDNFSLSVTNKSFLAGKGFSIIDSEKTDEISITSVNPVAGDYSVEVVVSSPNSSPVNKSCNIKISPQAFIIYPVSNKRELVGNTVSVSVYANNSNGDYSGVAFDITASDGQFLSCWPEMIDDSRIKCDFDVESDVAKNINIEISASTNYMTAAPQNFNIEFYNNPPVISLGSCEESVRLGENYSCDFGFFDPDGNSLGKCLADNLPSGFTFSAVSGRSICRLSGTSNEEGIYDMSFRAVDQYGAESEPVKLNVELVSYCGDGIKQAPNSEGIGGPSTSNSPNGDGYEDCDCGGLDYFACVKAGCAASGNTLCTQQQSTTGVPAVEQSNLVWQYGCTSRCFSANEGFCDDGVVQSSYGEQCDFGGDINCCQNCAWNTAGPTKKIGPLPEDRILSKGSSMTITLPTSPLSRGFSSGTFDASVYANNNYDKTGPAIVFAVDASYLAKFKIDDLVSVVKNFLTKLYKASNDNHANIYVSSFAFGNCAGGPICNFFKEDASGNNNGLVNFKNFTSADEGYMNYLEAISSVDSIVYYGDTTYDGRSSSGAIHGIKKASEILEACDSKCGTSANPNCVPNPKCQGATDKYLIILSDGVDVTESIDEAGNLKNKGIEIYSMVFTHRGDGAQIMSQWSSDYDNSSKTYIYPCNSGHYSYGNYYGANVCDRISSNFDSVNEANKIFDQIIKKVLDNIPTVINYSINGVNGTLSGSQSSVKFPLDNISCDISGQTPCSTKNFKFTLTGLYKDSGEESNVGIRFNNFILDRLPLCNEE